MRSFRLVEDSFVIPPVCVSLLCLSSIPTEQFSNNISTALTLVPDGIVFPPVLPYHTAIATSVISNNGDTAAFFSFEIALNADTQLSSTRSRTRNSAAHNLHDLPTFQVFPACGVLAPRSRQTVVWCFFPRAAQRFESRAFMHLSPHSSVSLKEGLSSPPHHEQLNIRLVGESYVIGFGPVDEINELYFPPTSVCAVNDSSTISRTFVNKCRGPIRLKWMIPSNIRSVLEVYPEETYLKGRQEIDFSFTFRPMQEGLLYMPIKAIFQSVDSTSTSLEANWDPLSEGTPESVYALMCIGSGWRGRLTVKPGSIKLAPVLTNHSVTHEIALFNNSRCNVSFELIVINLDEARSGYDKSVEVALDSKTLTVSRTDPPCETVQRGEVVLLDGESSSIGAQHSHGALVEKDFNKELHPDVVFHPSDRGTVYARSSKVVELTFTPKYRGTFQYLVAVVHEGEDAADLYRKVCKQLSEHRADIPEKATKDVHEPYMLQIVGYANPIPICHVQCICEQAVLQIVDAFSAFHPRCEIWQYIQGSFINQLLGADVTQGELATSGCSTFAELLTDSAHVTINLGSSVLNSAPIQLTIRLQNVTHNEVSFRFQLPDESDVSRERWYHQDVPTSEEIEWERLLEANVFSVQPRRGRMAPQSTFDVTFTFRQRCLGMSSSRSSGEIHALLRLPIIFSIEHGRRLVLWCTGYTQDPSVPRLYIPYPRHEFRPVAIGDLEPVLQYLEIRNATAYALEYIVDPNALESLRIENFNFPIFQCLNAQGMLEPYSSVQLQWYFRPLEAKVYEADVIMYQRAPSDESSELSENSNKSNSTSLLLATSSMHRIVLRGEGYHPRQILSEDLSRIEHQEHPEIPYVPQIAEEACPVRLSYSYVRWGRVPRSSLQHAIVLLTSDDPHRTFEFEWLCDSEQSALTTSTDTIIDVQPRSGVLRPGVQGSVMCRVTVYTGSVLHIVDENLQCVVWTNVDRNENTTTTPERHQVSISNHSRTSKKGSMARSQQNKVPITEATTFAFARHVQCRSIGQSQDLSSTRGSKSSKDLSSSRYSQSSKQCTKANQRDDPDDRVIRVLSLFLQYRTLDIEHYQIAYPNLFSKHHFPAIIHHSQYVDKKPPQPVVALDTMNDIEMTKLLKVLDDKSFAQLFGHRTRIHTDSMKGVGELQSKSRSVVLAEAKLIEAVLDHWIREVLQEKSILEIIHEDNETSMRAPDTTKYYAQISDPWALDEDKLPIPTDEYKTELIEARQRELNQMEIRHLVQHMEVPCLLEEVLEGVIWEILQESQPICTECKTDSVEARGCSETELSPEAMGLNESQGTFLEDSASYRRKDKTLGRSSSLKTKRHAANSIAS